MLASESAKAEEAAHALAAEQRAARLVELHARARHHLVERLLDLRLEPERQRRDRDALAERRRQRTVTEDVLRGLIAGARSSPAPADGDVFAHLYDEHTGLPR